MSQTSTISSTLGPGSRRGSSCQHVRSRSTLRLLLQRLRAKSFHKTRRSVIFTENPQQLNFSLSSSSSTDKTTLVQTTALAPAEPQTHRALVVARKGEYEVLDDFPMPHVSNDEVRIRCEYAGLNPIDWKSVEHNFCIVDFPWVCSDFPFPFTISITC